MLISELEDKYPLVYEAAISLRDSKRSEVWRERQFGSIYDLDMLGDAFFWETSPQGTDFWCAIDNRAFDVAKGICPELFEEEVKGTSHLKKANETVLSFERLYVGDDSYTFLAKPKPNHPQCEYMQITIMQDVLKHLNEFGQEGWQLVVKEGSMYTFMRSKL